MRGLRSCPGRVAGIGGAIDVGTKRRNAGTRVAITAIDVDLTATKATTPLKRLTAGQETTLLSAAVRQNSLYH
jgi:hypothetical protein